MKEEGANQSRIKDGIEKREVTSEGLDEVGRITERTIIEAIIARLIKSARKLKVSDTIFGGICGVGGEA